MEANVKKILNGRFSVVLMSKDDGTTTFSGSRAELREVCKKILKEISLPSSLIGKTVCPKSNPDRLAQITGIVEASNNVKVIWLDGLDDGWEDINDLRILD